MKLTDQYIAGFVDGEGYISILKLRRKSARGGIWYQPCIKISQREKDSEVLCLIYARYKGTFNKRRVYADNSLPSITLDIKNKQVIKEMLTNLLPYLVVKKKQAELVLEFISYAGVRSRNAEGKKIIDNLKEKQSQLYEKDRKLNKRGRRAETK